MIRTCPEMWDFPICVPTDRANLIHGNKFECLESPISWGYFVYLPEINLGFKTFIVSAGILPYPLTFLITDILSEVYGRKMTNRVVASGFFASIMVLLFLWLGSIAPAIQTSPINNETFNLVFSNAWRVIAASMIAYLSAQFLDVRLFHFWKNLTKGKHLWLRNNASTIGSQLVDTTLVVCVLFVGVWPTGQIIQAIIDGLSLIHI